MNNQTAPTTGTARTGTSHSSSLSLSALLCCVFCSRLWCMRRVYCHLHHVCFRRLHDKYESRYLQPPFNLSCRQLQDSPLALISTYTDAGYRINETLTAVYMESWESSGAQQMHRKLEPPNLPAFAILVPQRSL